VRNILVGIFAIVSLIGTPALAADMPVKAPPPMAPVAPITNWTGFYVGAQIGGASFDPSCNTTSNTGLVDFGIACTPLETEAADDPVTTSSLSSASVIGGVKVGYDYQWARVVLGVVGEFDWTHLNSSTQRTEADPNFSSVGVASERIDWLASARLRAGWAFDNVLFYATGGVAWTKINASASFTETIGPELASPEISSTKTGAVAGGGFEYRFTPNLSFVGELLWYDFGTTSVNQFCSTPAGCFTPTTFTTTFKSQDIVAGTLGVNWRF
jgi:outer membrane immunogenic protein